ncbi:unnamed protein product [Rotaria magnacalcarata]|uniref:PARP catalytic domain-containing protein n=1 Tax=Rotaria magnacalcarata TaxID=392030 RepID=A0A815E3P0_9BILA|nr:unnamed protein product [Rotaria magnacalcarata]CAF1347533.1 unnamed protein product [Rotaria magnacalcarata]CAF3952685.1 unnamed protein product [Rotaria magnacalcarata]CAF4029620.1 unnamed protein product [Rotaria magnacalcarata]
MAKAFIASAIGLNTNLRESLICSIHRGLLSHPMILPCKGKHRLCKECMSELIGTQQRITCPECREAYTVPLNWANDWFDRVLNDVTSTLCTNETDINQKIIKFVQESYSRYGPQEGKLHIKSVELVSNARLKAAFEKRKSTIGKPDVVTLLHGTTRKAALSISGQGFRIPTSFDRNPESGTEGQLKFGKAIYFAEAKKATEYGTDTLVLTDCILGYVQEKNESELQLTPEIMQRRGYNTIHYVNFGEGSGNQEWAIYKVEQCYPLCIIDYEILDANRASEQELVKKINKMNHLTPDWTILHKALTGTDNQCKEALRFIGDAGSKGTQQASRLMYSLLQCLTKNQINSLLYRTNETIRILFLRALWQTGRRDHNLQLYIHEALDWSLLCESLYSSYADVSWRACGVITNIAAVVVDVRHLLVSFDILNQLMYLLKRAVQFNDKTCILTVLNLLANIAATEHCVMKQKKDILDYVNGHLLDHPDEEIEEAGNRLFCNIIGQGTMSADWQRGGYKSTVMAPTIQ